MIRFAAQYFVDMIAIFTPFLPQITHVLVYESLHMYTYMFRIRLNENM